MGLKGRKTVFKRARSFIDRRSIFAAVRRYGKKLKPDFDGHTYLETVQCVFELPKEEQEKYRVTYDGKETFAFPMSDRYILGLYKYCILARQTIVTGEIPHKGFSEKEQGIFRLKGVRDVLFRCLLFDTIKFGEGVLFADLCTIYCLRENI